ncbi:unnamed protein product [Trypanosoma congolense IL3000]|uniref:Uncharacterized protein TCIL3000_11_9110 n=1 Tax=Trypanosoma congolense (strain IL3000) TaxID=1068625 RepID=F9W4B9_TRYCI|nr:unnamed protein product [Trypanosoma congolense IL3000]CCD12008.1 unnamed protein product [Trypanosoma congolense IL3000]
MSAPAGRALIRCQCSRAASLFSRRGYHGLFTVRRQFSFTKPKTPRVNLEEVRFDKQSPRYVGTVFGIPADAVVFYAKVGVAVASVCLVVSVFMKGYSFLARLNLGTVARLGFISGFLSCMVLNGVFVGVVRRIRINPNAVYNQSIAIVMQNEKVVQHLGTHPRTGDFKAYCLSGGFRLPLIRRIRSGSYELSDLLGLKPRKLQMMFILRNQANGYEGFVTCEVRRETTGFLSSVNTYKSLAVTLTDSSHSSPRTIVVIGRPEDVVYRGLMKL